MDWNIYWTIFLQVAIVIIALPIVGGAISLALSFFLRAEKPSVTNIMSTKDTNK